jgi:hypothetical protein
VGDAERVEERTHHRPLVLEVIGDQQPRRQQVGDLRQSGEMLRLLVDRERKDALGPELDLSGNQSDCFCLLQRGLIVGPERGSGRGA